MRVARLSDRTVVVLGEMLAARTIRSLPAEMQPELIVVPTVPAIRSSEIVVRPAPSTIGLSFDRPMNRRERRAQRFGR